MAWEGRLGSQTVKRYPAAKLNGVAAARPRGAVFRAVVSDPGGCALIWILPKGVVEYLL